MLVHRVHTVQLRSTMFATMCHPFHSHRRHSFATAQAGFAHLIAEPIRVPLRVGTATIACLLVPEDTPSPGAFDGSVDW